MKKEITPAMLVIAAVVVLGVVGGLYYTTLGAGGQSRQSNVASPYGLPKSAADFQKPVPTGSGRNSITGEPLSETATKAAASGSMMGAPPTTK
jgi:hypothetical protein